MSDKARSLNRRRGQGGLRGPIVLCAARTKETRRIRKVNLGNVNNAIRHCEEPLRRSDPGRRAVTPGLLRCANEKQTVIILILFTPVVSFKGVGRRPAPN